MSAQIQDTNITEEAENKLLDGSIDAGLFILEAITPRGVTLTQEEIAYVCGCSKGYIWLLEKQALQKLRKSPEARRLLGAI